MRVLNVNCRLRWGRNMIGKCLLEMGEFEEGRRGKICTSLDLERRLQMEMFCGFCENLWLNRAQS